MPSQLGLTQQFEKSSAFYDCQTPPQLPKLAIPFWVGGPGEGLTRERFAFSAKSSIARERSFFWRCWFRLFVAKPVGDFPRARRPDRIEARATVKTQSRAQRAQDTDQSSRAWRMGQIDPLRTFPISLGTCGERQKAAVGARSVRRRTAPPASNVPCAVRRSVFGHHCLRRFASRSPTSNVRTSPSKLTLSAAKRPT